MTCGVNGVSVFIRSFDKDAKWLEKTLPWLVRRGKGYDSIVVCGISGECRDVQRIAEANGVKFVAHDESAGIESGYINQQYSKMCADLLVTSGDIVYVDSDCLCIGDHTPDVFYQHGRPVLLYSEWSRVGDALCWKMPTEQSLGIVPRYEFMRRLPACYPASVVRGCREHIEKIHGKSLLEYMKPRKAFSEFNAIGCYAYEFCQDDFTLICPEKEPYPEIPFKQMWSHGGLNQLDPYIS